MKIKLLYLTAFLGLSQLLSAQTLNVNAKLYEPAANTVKVDFLDHHTVSEQKTAEGNRMVVAYEQGLHQNLSMISIYPNRGENMTTAVEERFMKLIADQANFYKEANGTPLVIAKQTIPALSTANGFATSFVIGDYTYAYRVMVVNNVYYVLSASSLTTNKTDSAITGFFNSFQVKATTNTTY